MNLLEQNLMVHPLRTLPVALGQMLANTRPGPQLDRLNRLYMGLSPADQLRCRDELAACRAAKRGECEAKIA